MDTKLEHSEATEVELNRLIERRSRKEPDPAEQEELWRESVRRFNAQKREANRRAWCAYFGRLADSLRARAEEYDRRVEKLMEDEPKGASLG